MPNQADSYRRLTRRGLFVAGGVTVAVVTAGSTTLRTGWLRALYLRLAYPEPEPSATGPMEGGLLSTLRTAGVTLLGEAAVGRSIRMLQTRAREVPGHLAMQTRFAAWLEKTAVAKGADDFQTAGPEMRAEILASCMRLRTNNDLRRAWNGVASRDHVLWDRHILQPMLELYSLTDAWLGLGYDTFPGDPSGLDSYREPIVGARGRRGIEERS